MTLKTLLRPGLLALLALAAVALLVEPSLAQTPAAPAEQAPARLAVADPRSALTYDQLNRRANQLAHRLKTLGVTREATVAVCMARSVEMIKQRGWADDEELGRLLEAWQRWGGDPRSFFTICRVENLGWKPRRG